MQFSSPSMVAQNGWNSRLCLQWLALQPKKGWSSIAQVEVRALRLVHNNRGHRAHDAQPELVRGIGDGELLRRFRQQVLLAGRTSKVRSPKMSAKSGNNRNLTTCQGNFGLTTPQGELHNLSLADGSGPSATSGPWERGLATPPRPPPAPPPFLLGAVGVFTESQRGGGRVFQERGGGQGYLRGIWGWGGGGGAEAPAKTPCFHVLLSEICFRWAVFWEMALVGALSTPFGQESSVAIPHFPPNTFGSTGRPAAKLGLVVGKKFRC